MIPLCNSMNVPLRVKGISIFNMIEQSIIDSIEKKYAVRIISAKIIGSRRWSFDGSSVGVIPVGASEKIQIDECSGAVVYNWQVLNEQQKKEIKEILTKNKEQYDN